MKATAELVPMGTITVQLGERVDVGQGPKGRRLVVDVLSVDVDCDRVKASLAVNDAADWQSMTRLIGSRLTTMERLAVST